MRPNSPLIRELEHPDKTYIFHRTSHIRENGLVNIIVKYNSTRGFGETPSTCWRSLLMYVDLLGPDIPICDIE